MIIDCNKSVVVLGAGGHAKVVAEALSSSGKEIIGFVAPNMKPGMPFVDSIILGDDNVLTDFSQDDVFLVNGIGVLPFQKQRWLVAKQMRRRGFTFSNVVHPSAIICRDVKLSEGVQVMAGSVIQPSVEVGQDSIINTGVLLDHDCIVSKNCHLAPGVVCSGGVSIGEGSFLGAGVVVMHNVSIGSNAIVGAGSIVYEDVPSNIRVIQKLQSCMTILKV